MTSVVTRTMITITAKRLAPISPSAMPTEATIRPTSPREIMPSPSRRLAPFAKPPSRAPSPLPSSFETIATALIASAKTRSPRPSARAFACSPIETKKSGTKKA